MNAFLSLMTEASTKRWCVKAGCTTCGCRKFRDALRALGDGLGPVLSELAVPELIRTRGWTDALDVAFHALPAAGRLNVLSAWLPQAPVSPGFVAFVLYAFVRWLEPGTPIRGSWLRAAIPVAVESKHSMLVETLVFMLGPGTPFYPELMAVAWELEADSPELTRALQKVNPRHF
jgi:hypothetical protein